MGVCLRRLGRAALVACLILAIVVGAGCGKSGGSSGDASPTVEAPFEIERVLEHIRALSSDIGPRPAGTEAERRGAEYIAGELEALGYSVDVQAFEYDIEYDWGSSLQIDPPDGESLLAYALVGSQASEVTGEIVDAGTGRPEEFPTEAEGRIALMQRGELEFPQQVANAAAAGAVAAVVYNDRPGPVIGEVDRAAGIPGATIAQEEGENLRGLIASGPLSVRLDIRTITGPQESVNVLARQSGGDCEIIVGGHHDSVLGVPGANDNASGTAAVLELARVFAGEDEGLCFVTFGSEEVGLKGSVAFVEALTDGELEALKGVVILDAIGAGEFWLLNGTPELITATGMAAREMDIGPFAPADGQAGAGSDHLSFNVEGVPGMLIYRAGDPRRHDPSDTIEFIEPQLIDEAMRMALSLMETLQAGD